jgi:quercetin dioxygenase-like cupin family protein
MGNKNQNSKRAQLTPFVTTLPDGNTKFFEILDQKRNLKLHSGLVTLKPGESVGAHTTGDHEELIIVLAGSGELEAEGLGRAKIAAGQIAYNPPHTQHDVINTGIEPLRYIYVVTKTTA